MQEAAQYYRVSPATIRRWIKTGKVQAHQVDTAQGFEWRVQLPDRPVDVRDPDDLVHAHDQVVTQLPIADVSEASRSYVQVSDHVQVRPHDQVPIDD